VTVATYTQAQPVLNGQVMPGYVPLPLPYYQGLTFMIHGRSKAGKSCLADSGPIPRLMMDVEGQGLWTPSRKIEWNPLQQSVPTWDGSWETCRVICREARVIHAAKKVLDSGNHPFNSASVDSVSEMQQRYIDELKGTRPMEIQDWGYVLRHVTSLTRSWRDLIVHPVKPLWSVSFVAGTHWNDKIKKWAPLVQGSSQDFLPYYVDVLGYLDISQDNVSRYLTIGPNPWWETGERLGGRLPFQMQIGYQPWNLPGYSVEAMLTQVLGG
jgi:hypothetical protein